MAPFGEVGRSRRSRYRRIWVFDKRSGSLRLARLDKTAFENDLYTARVPNLSGDEKSLADVAAAVFDPSNKDADVESLKADIEHRGTRALHQLPAWSPGLRPLSEEEREPVLSYVGLLLSQHPAMMAARTSVIHAALLSAKSALGARVAPPMTGVEEEFSRSEAVFGMIQEAFATAHELNYLAWKVVRWPGDGRLVVGDNAVAAYFPEEPLGTGDVWTPGARFTMPVTPNTMLVLAEVAPGVCFVEERSPDAADDEMDVMNLVSWARARSEVYGRREDLERMAARLGELRQNGDYSLQLPVRREILVQLSAGTDGEVQISRPAFDGAAAARRRYDSLHGPRSETGT